MGHPFQTHGAISWGELVTSDPDAAGAFYAGVLGWKIEDGSMGSDDRYDVVEVDGEKIGGIMNMPPQAPAGMPPQWGIYVTVDDVDEVVAKAEALGGRVLWGPVDISGVGRLALLSDPQGATFSVVAYEAR
jgi:hypothetical protein